MKLNKNGNYIYYGIFWCDSCEQEVTKDMASGKKQKSCGCEHNKGINNPNYKDGRSQEKLYHILASIKDRCSNFNSKDFIYYGGRGISVCPEWTNDYAKFRDWALENGYQEGLEIDREDTNGNYSPENCRWIIHEENMRNIRYSKIENIEQANEIRTLYNSGYYTQKQLAEKYNVNQSTISKIIKNKLWKNI